jgi:hypothetical protein
LTGLIPEENVGDFARLSPPALTGGRTIFLVLVDAKM